MSRLCIHQAFFSLMVFQVTAMNHVSALTEDFNVTVDRLQPMTNLTVKGVPDVVPQGSTQTLTTSALIDMSVPATVRYEHGERERFNVLAAPFSSHLSLTSVFFFLPSCVLIGPCSSLASYLLPCSLNRLLTKNFPLRSAAYAVLSTFLYISSVFIPLSLPFLPGLCAAPFRSICLWSLRSWSRETS